jgi:hypothetical protein
MPELCFPKDSTLKQHKPEWQKPLGAPGFCGDGPFLATCFEAAGCTETSGLEHHALLALWCPTALAEMRSVLAVRKPACRRGAAIAHQWNKFWYTMV